MKQTAVPPVEDLIADTLKAEEALKAMESQLGAFGTFAAGEETFYTLENNLVKLTLSSKGGRISSVELKEYKTHDGKPLILFEGDNSQFALNFFSQNRNIRTDQLYFSTASPARVVLSGPEVKTGDKGDEKFNSKNLFQSDSISFRIEFAPGVYLEHVYALNYNTYMVDFNVNMQGLDGMIAANQPYINLAWSFDVPRQERKSQYGEDRYTNIYYQFY